ncbi:UNVERIFIED_CONTAM: prolyl-tRNA synthetase associated domain-containing protein [Streptococcus canis]|uniref:Prolyl-tRNA synthetase associated domain-containing protein n=1 Tax=Streptococcus canis TaxID=1329 RepID=A0AAE4Q7A6_STRCB|nr:prolyl-tRNA synthetase associated domain-containing protein [Streptococcus canis]MDV5976165.1 prolyl-tRNA synthetase associated domain-containing protein [Streptococcus canis]
MNTFENVIAELEKLNISYELVEHEPALTTAQADGFIEGIEGVRTKAMFLTNKKKTQYYLLIMDDQKLLDMECFKELVGANRIRMASADSLYRKMLLPPGVVSPFGLMNNQDKDILVYFDQAIVTEERMSFHPNTNDRTIFINTKDLFSFLEHLGYEVNTVEL